MAERSVGEIALDPEYARKYLGIREEKSPDGSSFGVLLACSGSDGLVVLNVIKATKENHDGLYYFFEPLVEGSERKVTLIEDRNSKIVGSL